MLIGKIWPPVLSKLPYCVAEPKLKEHTHTHTDIHSPPEPHMHTHPGRQELPDCRAPSLSLKRDGELDYYLVSGRVLTEARQAVGLQAGR